MSSTKPLKCHSCIGASWQGFVPPMGQGTNGVFLCFEAAGEQEAESGEPMKGRAGFRFAQLLGRLGLTREQFWVGNILWCRPPGNRLREEAYEDEAVATCTYQYLRPWLEKARPKVIVAGGEVALRWLTGRQGITKMRGYTYWNEEFQCWVVPTLHPSYIMRGKQNLSAAFLRDIWHAVQAAKDGYAYAKEDFLLDPTPLMFRQWCDRAVGAEYLSFDIETPDKKGVEEALIEKELAGDDDWGEEDEPDLSHPITRIGFACRDYEAVSIPWRAEYVPDIKRLLTCQAQKIVWNKWFDVPRLAFNKVPVTGVIHDGMVAWHILHSDLPKGLGFVAPFVCPDVPEWKSKSQGDPALYNAYDAEVECRGTVKILGLLRESGLYSVYQRDVLDLEPVLQHMATRGMPVSREAQREAVKVLDENKQATLASMNAVVPVEVLGHSPTMGYVREPVIVTADMIQRAFVDEVKRCARCGMVDPPAAHVKVFERKENPCGGAAVVTTTETVMRWVKVKPFVPSTTQLLKYQAYKKHPLVFTKATDGGKRSTTDAKALRKLRASYPDDVVYRETVQYRKAQKIGGYLGSVVDGVIQGGMPIFSDDRIHGHFTHNPSTLRLSMVSPNLTNIPRTAGEFDRLVKRIFTTSNGHLFWSRDFSGIEAVLVGWFAGSRQYVRLAKLGVHAFFASHVLKRPADLSWSDEDLRRYFKELKEREKPTYEIAKRVVHLSNYLGTPAKMHMEYPDTFRTQREAKYYQDYYFDLFKEIQAWHEQLCLSSYKTCTSVNPFGYVHRYYAIVNWKKVKNDWKWEYGDDAKRLIANSPQSTAAAILKQAVKRIYYGYPDVAETLRLLVHDEILGETPAVLLDRCLGVSRVEMERPIPELPLDPAWGMGEYLSIGTEAKVGRCWETMR